MMSDLWRPYDKSRLGLSGSRASGSDCCIQAAGTSEVTEQTCRSTDTSVQRATASPFGGGRTCGSRQATRAGTSRCSSQMATPLMDGPFSRPFELPTGAADIQRFGPQRSGATRRRRRGRTPAESSPSSRTIARSDNPSPVSSHGANGRRRTPLITRAYEVAPTKTRCASCFALRERRDSA